MDSVEGLRFGVVVVVGGVEEEEAVMRVLITQIGFVMRTVADPARAPQSMDSTVVRALLARLVRRAARVKRERVHSYPLFSPLMGCELAHADNRGKEDGGGGGGKGEAEGRGHTVVINEIRHRDAE